MKESDRIKMFGVLPSQGADPIPVGKIPDGATQILEDTVATNETAIIHTVNSGKTLYLVTWVLSAYLLANGYIALRIRNTEDTITFDLALTFITGGTTVPAIIGSAIPPIEVPEGYDIVIFSSVAGLSAQGGIFGYEM